MRFIVVGAGAVGGVVGGRLFQYGQEVLLVARGEHAATVEAEGLTLASATGVVNLPVPVVRSVSQVAWAPGDVVLLAVKSQDTEQALDQLAAVAPPATPLVCLQNGVTNEPAALRRFANVYGVCVMCPAAHMKPGVVVAESSPVTALLDIGRYPSGADATARAISDAFASSTMGSEVREDIMRWKYAKLLRNLANAVDALCGPDGQGSQVAQMARLEGEACLRAAGIDHASETEDRLRRGNILHPTDVVGHERGGSSTWQSLARGQGSVEVDYLNGEIVLLGRQYGVPTPVNELLQTLANRKARQLSEPGTMTPDELLALLGQAG